MPSPTIVRIATGLVSTWAEPSVAKSYLRKVAGAVAVSASAPTTIAELITLVRPEGVTRGSIFMKNTYARTVGVAAWAGASLSTNSVIHGIAAPAPELLTLNPVANVGSNTGSICWHQANSTSASGTAALQQSTVGVAGVSNGYAYGGLIDFSHNVNTLALDNIGAIAFAIILEPAATPAAGETYTITTDLYAVWS